MSSCYYVFRNRFLELASLKVNPLWITDEMLADGLCRKRHSLPIPPPADEFGKGNKMTVLHDSFNRSLTYLRISLTDRCNFRCVYCMPPEGITLLPREEVLRLDEFEKLARLFVSLGIKKIRLTGGEPLLRHKLVSFVSELSHIPGLEEVALTTNASFLEPLVEPLVEAGLKSINMSCDSLDPVRFRKITRNGDFDAVWKGIKKALCSPLKTKINVVALSDLSREEVRQFMDLAIRYQTEVRFIEFMPLCGSGSESLQGLDMEKLRNWIEEDHLLDEIPRGREVAKSFRLGNSLGRVGFISSLTEPFCSTCSRLRLSSAGQLRLCLFSPIFINLRKPLRMGGSDEEMLNLIRRGVWLKPKGHEEVRQEISDNSLPVIRSIGG